MLVYNEKTKQYERDGVVITAVMLRELIDKLTTYARGRARQLGKRVEAGEISPAQFANAMSELLAASIIIAEVVSGRNDMSKAGDKIAWQRRYLDKFVSSVAAGVVTSGIAARAGSYTSAIYPTFANGRFEERKEADKEMLCRLITHSKEGCSECADDEADGWVPVSEMGELGTRECGDFCLCTIEFEDEVNGETTD